MIIKLHSPRVKLKTAMQNGVVLPLLFRDIFDISAMISADSARHLRVSVAISRTFPIPAIEAVDLYQIKCKSYLI